MMKLGKKGKPDKKVLILIGAAAVVLIGVIAAVIFSKNNSAESITADEQETLADAAETDGIDVQEDEENGDNDSQNEQDNQNMRTDQEEDVDGGEVKEEIVSGSVENPQRVPDIVINLNEEPQDTVEEQIEFPYSIGGTELSVDKIAPYDGIYIEDGSDEEISGVAALVLTNHGADGVEYAEVSVSQASQTLSFKATAIPSGASVVVLEAGRTSWSEEPVTQIYASASDSSEFGMAEDAVQITDNGDDSISVTNVSGKEIPCVRIFYKYKLEDNIYVGGIAYMVKITGLEAGASKTVRPSHYASGSSEMLMARIYDTAD